MPLSIGIIRFRSLPATLAVLAGFLLFSLMVQSARGQQTFTLIDGNASIVVDASSTPTSRAAINSWLVSGVEHLQEVSNWYRIGGTPGGNIPETSAHTLQLISKNQTGPNTASVVYGHQQFELRFDYTVVGGAPGHSSMGETVHIRNTGSTPLDFHFFEYIDLDLSNTAGDDIGKPVNPNKVDQFDGQTFVTTGAALNYDRHEFGFFPTVLNHLGNTGAGSTSTLNNLPPFGNTFGPGDVTFALQWDFAAGFPRPAILPGDTVIITKNLMCMPIPEPATGAAAAMIFAALRRGRPSSLIRGIRRPDREHRRL